MGQRNKLLDPYRNRVVFKLNGSTKYLSIEFSFVHFFMNRSHFLLASSDDFIAGLVIADRISNQGKETKVKVCLNNSICLG